MLTWLLFEVVLFCRKKPEKKLKKAKHKGKEKKSKVNNRLFSTAEQKVKIWKFKILAVVPQ